MSNQAATGANLPIVVHFGCGRLSIGAVLPFLISRYGATHRIVVVQRRSKDWRSIPDGVIMPLITRFGSNHAPKSSITGDFMPLRTCVVDQHGSLDGHPCAISLKKERRLLILVQSLAFCEALLGSLHKQSNGNLIVSVSVGPGQAAVVQLLRVWQGWSHVLLFENTQSHAWERELGTRRAKKVHHVLTDRICWNIEPFDAEKERAFVRCHCEPPEAVRIYWPVTAGIPKAARSRDVPGEFVCSDKWLASAFPTKEKDWRYLQKRALINAPHAITALLCYRLMSHRGMNPDDQYLAPLQEILKGEAQYADWERAMDCYLRLRAIEVAWKRQDPKGKIKSDDIDVEKLHRDYTEGYQIAGRARLRFFGTNDRLDRIMSPGRLGKELEKFDEHILRPMQFYDEKCQILEEKWIFGKPQHAEFLALRDFLMEAFLDSTLWLSQFGTKQA